MDTKKSLYTNKIILIALAAVLCLSLLLTGCGKTEKEAAGTEYNGITDEAPEAGNNGITGETSKEETAEMPEEDTPAAETPEEDTPAAETPEEDTPAAETPEEDMPAAETPEEDDSYIVIEIEGEVIAKVPSVPLTSWMQVYAENGEYLFEDEDGNQYSYKYFSGSDTWRIFLYWPGDSMYAGYYRADDGSWFVSDGQE